LVEKNVLAVSTLSRKLLQVPVLAYSMFLAQLLPKLTPN